MSKTKKTLIGLYVDKAVEPGILYQTLYHLLLNISKSRNQEILLLCEETSGKIQHAVAQLPHQKIINKEKRLGRPILFNQFIEKPADYYVLMDVGVLATNNWLSRMEKSLEQSHRHGIAGPTTNNYWNSQGKYWDQDPLETEIPKRVESLEKEYGDGVVIMETLYNLGEFCFAVKRDVIEVIGKADINYQNGFCWEMDYQVRAARAGFKGIWVKDSYVHRIELHHRPDREKSFQQNKNYYQEKFCGLRLRNRTPDYCHHCIGEECRDFAPKERIQIKLNHQQEEICDRGDYPLVSCIMPTKARASYVEQSIRYFLQQDYPEKELVIVYEESGDLPEKIRGGELHHTDQKGERAEYRRKKKQRLQGGKGRNHSPMG